MHNFLLHQTFGFGFVSLLCKNSLLKNLDHVQPKLDLAWVGAVSLSHDAVMLSVSKSNENGQQVSRGVYDKFLAV